MDETTARALVAWDVAYGDDGTPSWETGHPQPAVSRLIAEGALRGAVLDAGCGTGLHAVLLARSGCAVVGVDIAANAIDRARRRARASGVDVAFEHADLLRQGAIAPASVDAVLDVGLFHALQPAERATYARRLADAVRPGGAGVVIAWSDRNPFGYGPARIRRRDLRRTFTRATGWRVTSIEETELETRLEPGTAHAWLARLSRR